MAAVTIRNLSAATHQALKARAADHGRSTEAEIRMILDNAVSTETAEGLVADLIAIGQRYNITTEFDNLRDQSPPRIITFE